MSALPPNMDGQPHDSQGSADMGLPVDARDSTDIGLTVTRDAFQQARAVVSVGDSHPIILEHFGKVFAGEMKAKNALMTDKQAFTQYHNKIANNNMFRNMSLETPSGAVFIVDANLATSLSEFLFSKCAHYKHVHNCLYLTIVIPDSKAYFLDRFVQFMYFQKYDFFPHRLNFVESGYEVPQSDWDVILPASVFELHVTMFLFATDLESDPVQDYALRKIIGLFSKGISFESFVATARYVFKRHKKLQLLKQILALYAASMDAEWMELLSSPVQIEAYSRLKGIGEFSRMLCEALSERRRPTNTGAHPNSSFGPSFRIELNRLASPAQSKLLHTGAAPAVVSVTNIQGQASNSRVAFGSLSNPYERCDE